MSRDKSPRLCVVLPTYNEGENVERMAAALVDVFERNALDGHVLIVDDTSPDGTGEIAERLAASDRRIDVLHRPAKEGLGRAYAAGFKRALENGADLVIAMDCDFSHDPNDVPRVVNAIEDADVALGSRYVEGGSIVNWSFLRRLISKGGCAYAKLLLGIPVRDLTGGFKCFRSEALRELDAASANAAGYAFQIEMTYRSVRRGHRIAEIPIVFREREAGRSKMSLRIALEAALIVPLLRIRLRGQTANASATREAYSS